MSTRSEILKKIRGAVGGPDEKNVRRVSVEQHIKRHPAGTLPSKISSKAGAIKLFIKRAKSADATVEQCGTANVAEQVASFLREHNLPATCRTGTDYKLKRLVSSKANLLELSEGPSDGNDITAISCALGGAAETGTLILVSGPENPTTLNFLPENHIVILHEKDIVPHQEDLWKKIRKKYGSGEMPRTVNMITGPSRSADIEQTLILGAHGPLRLHIIIVKG